MILRIVGWFSLAALLSAAAYLLLPETPRDKQPVFDPLLVSASNLPRLEDERTSPYFSRELKYEGGKKSEEILRFRQDHSVAHLVYGSNGLLRRVVAYREVNDQQKLVYEADYDVQGRRILQARFYGLDGGLETLVERDAAGGESHKFFRQGKLLQSVTLAPDGSQTTVNYDAGGAVTANRTEQPPAASTDLAFWDSARSKVRLRVHMKGARLDTWEYFAKDGKLDHSGRVLADGSLEFSYLENGKTKRRQIWRLVGEDWERSYYGLSYSELLADDGKSVENKVWVRSNGSLLRHERFDAKTGKLEMQREFDSDSRVARVEDFTVTGNAQRLWIFPASGTRSRGFVPSGMRDTPGEDQQAGSVYNLDGTPFSHSVLDRHPWAFFQAK